MKENNSGYAENRPFLSSQEAKILAFVQESWPSCALDVAEHFHADLSSPEARKRASAKFSYYLRKLVDKRLLLSKRIGNALIAWPLEVEKYRAVHSILRAEQGILHGENRTFSVMASSPKKTGPEKTVERPLRGVS